MANEISVVQTLQFTKDNTTKQISTSFKANVAGSNYHQGNQAVPTTAGGTALNLGTCGSVGWCIIRNLDSANTLKLYTAVSGTLFAALLFGESACFRFDTSITAPAAIAITGTVRIEVLIVEI